MERTDEDKVSRKCAAKLVRRLVKTARTSDSRYDLMDAEESVSDTGFVVTNGMQSFSVTLIEVGRGAPPLLMFLDDIPPRNTEMWVVHHSVRALKHSPIGFTGDIASLLDKLSPDSLRHQLRSES